MIWQSTKLTELPLSVTVCLWLTAAACFSLAKDDLYSFIIWLRGLTSDILAFCVCAAFLSSFKKFFFFIQPIVKSGNFFLYAAWLFSVHKLYAWFSHWVVSPWTILASLTRESQLQLSHAMLLTIEFLPDADVHRQIKWKCELCCMHGTVLNAHIMVIHRFCVFMFNNYCHLLWN